MLWERSWLRKILCLFCCKNNRMLFFNHTWAMKKGPWLFTRLFFGDENPTQFLLGSFHKPLYRSVVINQTTNQYFNISMESTVNWNSAKFCGSRPKKHIGLKIFNTLLLFPTYQRYHLPPSIWVFPKIMLSPKKMVLQLHAQLIQVVNVNWVFPKIRVSPKWMVKIMENPIKMDDLNLGVP